jgi:hypothetical protein
MVSETRIRDRVEAAVAVERGRPGSTRATEAKVRAGVRAAEMATAVADITPGFSFRDADLRIEFSAAPAVVLDRQGQLVGTDAYVRVFRGAGEVRVDRHRRFVNPPTQVPDGTTSLFAQTDLAGNFVQMVERPNYREDARAAYLACIVDSIRSVPYAAGWSEAGPGTVTTVYAGTADARIVSNGAFTWLQKRSGAATLAMQNDTSTQFYFGQDAGGIVQGFFNFDTSAIADDQAVSAAALSISTFEDQSATDFFIEARLYDWGAAVTTADWVVGSTWNGLALLARFDMASWASGYLAFTEYQGNLSKNINLTGITSMVLCSDRFGNAAEALGNEYLGIDAADTAGTTSDPKIAITHATATCALTGTATATINEADIVAAGKTLIKTLTGALYAVAAGRKQILLVGYQKGSFAGTTSAQDITFALVGGLATTPAAGDLVIATYAIGSTVTRTPNIRNSAGTAYGEAMGGALTQADNFDVSQITLGRFMPGTPETVIRFTEATGGGTGDVADAGAYAILVLRDVDPTTVLDVAAVTAGAANSSTVNPGSITPTTLGAVIVIAGSAASATGATFTAPYLAPGPALSGTQADTNDISLLMGFRSWMTGAYDGAAFGSVPAGTTANSWACVTLAIRPAPTTPFDDARAALRSGVDSAQSEATGFDALRDTILPLGNIVRTSDTVVTMTFAAAATYNITAQEVVTDTIPASALQAGPAIVASPTFTIDTAAGGVSVTPTTAALVLTTFAPTVLTPRLVTPTTAALVLTTFAPTVATPVLVTPGKASLVLTTFAPTVTAPQLVTPTTAALVLATFAPTVVVNTPATPTTAALVLTTFEPTVTVASAGRSRRLMVGFGI